MRIPKKIAGIESKEFAGLIGVAHSRVNALLQRGMPRNQDRSIDFDAAIEWVEDNVRGSEERVAGARSAWKKRNPVGEFAPVSARIPPGNSLNSAEFVLSCLSSMPIRVVLLDEVDRYPLDVGSGAGRGGKGEGDPSSLSYCQSPHSALHSGQASALAHRVRGRHGLRRWPAATPRVRLSRDSQCLKSGAIARGFASCKPTIYAPLATRKPEEPLSFFDACQPASKRPFFHSLRLHRSLTGLAWDAFFL